MARKLTADPKAATVTKTTRQRNLQPISPNPRAVIGDNKPPKVTKPAPADPMKVNAKMLAGLAKAAGTLGQRITDNKKLAEVATKTRGDWFEFGRILAEAREVIPSNKLFNGWLKDNNLEAYADRVSRSSAMNISRWTDDMRELVPAQIIHPKNVLGWYNKTMAALTEAMAEPMKTEGANPDTAAEALSQDLRDFYDCLTPEAFKLAMTKYQTKPARVDFNDSPVAEAVAKIVAKISKHVSAVDLATAVILALGEELKKDTPFSDVADTEEGDEPAEEGEEGDEPATDEPVDYVEEPEEGNDEGDEDDEPSEDDEGDE